MRKLFVPVLRPRRANAGCHHVPVMTLDELRASLTDDAPPRGVPATIEALWYDARDGSVAGSG